MNRIPLDDTEFARIADHYAYDRELPLEAATVGSWGARKPYLIEKVEFSSTHDQRVPAFFTHPKEAPEAPSPAVVLLHGANDFWGKNEDWALEWMDILSLQGWCVLVADAYGFGERKQADQQVPVFPGADTQTPYAQRAALIQIITDHRRGLDYVLSRPEVDASRVALMGGSLGGYHGVFVAGLEERFAAVVLTVIGAWPKNTATDDPMDRFSQTLNFAPHLSAPLLMVNATGDGRESGTELFDRMPDPKQQIWYESNHYLPPRDYNEDIVRWLHERLET